MDSRRSLVLAFKLLSVVYVQKFCVDFLTFVCFGKMDLCLFC
uniref:Uncharacterized protein n=1 Tax=Rhizophora mucronata TaxID=61149 RepID=A0A2P2Q4L4_RHIMU